MPLLNCQEISLPSLHDDLFQSILSKLVVITLQMKGVCSLLLLQCVSLAGSENEPFKEVCEGRDMNTKLKVLTEEE